jgi:hypothetical protein
MSANGQWVTLHLELPPALQSILDVGADGLDAVATFLEAQAAFLQLIADMAQALFDAYSAIVNALITMVQNFLLDLKNAGIYVFLDYPNNLKLSDFNPAAEENWEGTIFDDDLLAAASLNDVDLVAIAKQRKSWSRQSNMLLSFGDVLSRISTGFYDVHDPYRPRFSETAATFGVVILAYSVELALFLKMVRQLSDIFALSDLRGILQPAIVSDAFKALWGKAVDEWDSVDWENWKPQLPASFRNPGAFPNWLGRFTFQDLFPPLGQLLQALANMLELLRPNGDIAKFIQDMINALVRKVDRIRRLAETLAELADLIRNVFSGTQLCACAINSAEGNSGFINGLRSAKGAPQFEKALCCSVVLYTGGPGIVPLQLLFSGEGEPIPGSSYEENLENERQDEPIVPPDYTGRDPQ